MLPLLKASNPFTCRCKLPGNASDAHFTLSTPSRNRFLPGCLDDVLHAVGELSADSTKEVHKIDWWQTVDVVGRDGWTLEVEETRRLAPLQLRDAHWSSLCLAVLTCDSYSLMTMACSRLSAWTSTEPTWDALKAFRVTHLTSSWLASAIRDEYFSLTLFMVSLNIEESCERMRLSRCSKLCRNDFKCLFSCWLKLIRVLLSMANSRPAQQLEDDVVGQMPLMRPRECWCDECTLFASRILSHLLSWTMGLHWLRLSSATTVSTAAKLTNTESPYTAMLNMQTHTRQNYHTKLQWKKAGEWPQ